MKVYVKSSPDKTDVSSTDVPVPEIGEKELLVKVLVFVLVYMMNIFIQQI